MMRGISFYRAVLVCVLVMEAPVVDAAHSINMSCAQTYADTLYHLKKSSEALNNSGFSLPAEQERLLEMFEAAQEAAMNIRITETGHDSSSKSVHYALDGPYIDDSRYQILCRDEILGKLCLKGFLVQNSSILCKIP